MDDDRQGTGPRPIIIEGATARLGDHIRLWTADADILGGRVDLSCLSRAEVALGSRLRAPRAAERWLTGQALLRQMLGACLDLPADRVAFEREPTSASDLNKPRLRSDQRRGHLGFSIMRSGPFVVMAVARQLELGVGCERIDPKFDWGLAARRALNTEERQAVLAHAQEPTRRLAFYEIWARKRAVLYALGANRPIEPSAVHIDRTGDSRRWTPARIMYGSSSATDHRVAPRRAAELRVASVETPDGLPVAVAVVGRRQPAVEIHALDDQVWVEDLPVAIGEGARIAM